MRLFTNLLFKVTLSSMVLTAPAMISGNHNYAHNGNPLPEKESAMSFYSSTVIRKYIDHPTMVVRAIAALAVPAVTVSLPAVKMTPLRVTTTTSPAVAMTVRTPEPVSVLADKAAAKAAELRMVINQASFIYTSMNLSDQGLDPKAFEYAWRGYHNLLKKGVIHKRSVLSICDFSQSSRAKRMYVIDVQHRKLLYRTYVAHGQNSGDEYATSFSNEPNSYKSSLGFYVTMRTYIGHNGLSLKLNGVDSGYNDMALQRQIVLHGSSYVSDKYMQNYGTLGTSLGCPALPAAVSGKIIRLVKDGSCLFIYHPTPQYLDNSPVING
ncbi:MAG TPA: murein L,D-transpeptidase catalytic domain family protein [Puia sp.]|nr:murein L,D-transpeptidase catalytic domain family protein [Puia sp.]